MIIEIDDKYFNPEQVTGIKQSGNDVEVHLSAKWEAYLLFKNWKVQNLAAEINRNIEEFHIDNYRRALSRYLLPRITPIHAKKIVETQSD